VVVVVVVLLWSAFVPLCPDVPEPVCAKLMEAIRATANVMLRNFFTCLLLLG
jgi:hypothetical protein